tara:strand:+ start:3104 stop:4303 length:1200 start_codon:yes stop_codon:yes gene_type:complete
MDAHSDTTTLEQPSESSIDNLPTEPDSLGEGTSFADALESALSNLENPPVVEEEPSLESEKPVEETPTEPEVEPEVEKTSEEVTGEDSSDSLESLTEDIGDDWTPKAANRFKQLKSELKTNRSEMEQLQQLVKEQENKISEMNGLVEGENLEQLKTKVAEYEQKQALTNLEDTDAYKEAVSTPLNSIFDSINNLSEKYDVEPDHVLDALGLDKQQDQDDKLSDLFQGASDRDKAKLYRLIDEIEPIVEKRDNMHKNAGEALNEAKLLEEQKRNAVAAEEAKHRATVTGTVVDRVLEKLPFLKGIEELNMESIREKTAAEVPNVIHPVDFAYNSVAAQLLPVLVKEYFQTARENDTLTDRLAEFEGAEPTMSGAAAVDSSGVSKDLDFASAIEAALGSTG